MNKQPDLTKEIQNICCTSVDDAKTAIWRERRIEVLQDCLAYEKAGMGRASMLKMITGKLNNLEYNGWLPKAVIKVLIDGYPLSWTYEESTSRTNSGGHTLWAITGFHENGTWISRRLYQTLEVHKANLVHLELLCRGVIAEKVGYPSPKDYDEYRDYYKEILKHRQVVDR
jgi:hypothetical protein